MIRKSGGALLVLALLMSGCATSYPSVAGVSTDAPAAGALAELSFLTGCWRGIMPDGSIAEERFSIPGGETMLGNSRIVLNGRTTSWEFSRIAVDQGEIVLRAYPGGNLSEAEFRLTDVVAGAQAVFSDLTHDYPKRIRYQLIAAGVMQITLDGGEGSDRLDSWVLAQASCVQ